MSKAEERGKIYALHKASEKLNDYYGSAMLSVVQFDGYDIKNAYIEGYHQAEKDLELTVDDIMKLDALLIEMWNRPSNEDKYQEVLKRFKSYVKKEI